MPITGKDATEEMINARTIVQDEKTTVVEKVMAVAKLCEVILKVLLPTRDNTTMIMEKLGIPKRKSRRIEETVEEKVEE